MNDMTFGLRGADAADEPFWPGRPGKNSPDSGEPSPIGGNPYRVAPAPNWLQQLADFLRAQHPTKTAEAVSARCRGRIGPEQVRKWLQLRAAPGGEALLWLATGYGPRLLVALFGPSPITRPDWLAAALKAERVKELDQRLDALRIEFDRELGRR